MNNSMPMLVPRDGLLNRNNPSLDITRMPSFSIGLITQLNKGTGMTSNHTPIVAQAPSARSLIPKSPMFVQRLVRSRFGFALAASALVAGGLAVGWEWLAMAGVLPLILSVLPCVAMCALGLCMTKGKNGQSCSSQTDRGRPARGKHSVQPL